MATAEIPRRWAWPALATVLAGGLGLRLWGIGQGLPYAYNTDEGDHFLPRAVAMFGRDLNPHYFANPPAFTYVLHYLFAIAYGGKTGVRQAFALHPSEVYTLGRAAAAVLGAVALWLLYATGARLFGRGIGLLAAAIEAVAFLPVFYSHLALNDVPTLAPLTLSLLGSAGVLRYGRKRDYLLAGLGLGLACASKYTAGIVLLPFIAAAAASYLDGEGAAARRTLIGIALTAAVAVASFLLANPYAVLDYSKFHAELIHQSTLSAEAQGKLGAPRTGGAVYYLWTLTWGLGWVPALAALGGALTLWFHGRSQVPRLMASKPRDGEGPPPPASGVALGWMLVPAPVVFLVFMGLQGRYFGRWLLPIFPILCLLAAFFAVRLADRASGLLGSLRGGRASSRPLTFARPSGSSGARASRGPRVALMSLLVLALLAQGLVYSIHAGRVLSRADTRGLTRQWMLAHIAQGAKIVVEPVAPDAWASTRWRKYPSLSSRIAANGAVEEIATREVGIEDYERTLAPALLGYYEAHGYCWVVSGSTQSGRAFADPRAVPGAIAYYRALARQGEVVYRASPYAPGKGPVAFGFDWSFDYYPMAYERPGPGDDRISPQGRTVRALSRVILESDMPACTATDEAHLARAIELAHNGAAAVRPNPVVGAVIARDGEVSRPGLARGVRRRPRGGQRDRGVRTGRSQRGDPVCVAGTVLPRGQRTPCTEAILQAGLRRVVVASDDPTEKASGRGLGILRDEGVEVVMADGELGRQGPTAESGLSQARPRGAAMGAVQVGDDARRQGGDAYGGLQVDQR